MTRPRRCENLESIPKGEGRQCMGLYLLARISFAGLQISRFGWKIMFARCIKTVTGCFVACRVRLVIPVSVLGRYGVKTTRGSVTRTYIHIRTYIHTRCKPHTRLPPRRPSPSAIHAVSLGGGSKACCLLVFAGAVMGGQKSSRRQPRPISSNPLFSADENAGQGRASSHAVSVSQSWRRQR